MGPLENLKGFQRQDQELFTRERARECSPIINAACRRQVGVGVVFLEEAQKY
jgi:hypothetical protein